MSVVADGDAACAGAAISAQHQCVYSCENRKISDENEWLENDHVNF